MAILRWVGVTERYPDFYLADSDETDGRHYDFQCEFTTEQISEIERACKQYDAAQDSLFRWYEEAKRMATRRTE